VGTVVAGALASILLCPVAASAAGGDQEWVARDFGAGHDLSAGMALSPDGGTVYVAGTAQGQFAVTARDAATGDARWQFRASHPQDLADFAHAVTISPDGTLVFVTGDAEVTPETRDFVTVAIEAATGDLVWGARESPGPGRAAIPDAIEISPDGTRVFVTGSRTGTQGFNDFWDYFTVAYDAATGDRTWSAVYRGPGTNADVPIGMEVSPGGERVYVTGTSVGDGTGRDYATVAYDAASGSELWAARHGTGGDDYAAGLVSGPGGNRLYVTGTIRPGGQPSMGTVVYDGATGAEIDAATSGGGSASGASAITLSPNGALVFVTGSGGLDFLTVALSAATLRQLWTARYAGPGVDVPANVAVSPNGRRVYVTGTSDNDRLTCGFELLSTDIVTVAYGSRTGSTLWSARYIGTTDREPDQATDVAIGPDGSSVFVTGTSDGGCYIGDVATISYAG
jgi:DNA-binding beta-propeller fold protein YncE